MPEVHKNQVPYSIGMSFLLAFAVVAGLFVTHRLLFFDAKEFASLAEWFFSEVSKEYLSVLLLVFLGLFGGTYFWLRRKTPVM